MSCRTIQLPDQAALRRLLDYDANTGVLTWKVREGWHQWSTRWAGKPALTAFVHGYRHGHLNGRLVRAHRVIWKWMTGDEPDEVDHLNGERADNRWCNLRNVSRVENGRNVGKSALNTSGVTGVIWERRRAKWYARATLEGRSHHIGSYDSRDEAHRARVQFLQGRGFTTRHLGEVK